MPTFKKDDGTLKEMAAELISKYDDHESLRNGVRIDFLFAYPDLDETTGEPTNNALTKGGIKCLGIARKLNLKDRTKGLGDAEISIDGHWWEQSDEADQRALLDHELHHLVATEKRDNLGRPIIKLRKHDFEFGWFTTIAARHGLHSQEQKQAASIVEIAGQYFFPSIAKELPLTRMQRLEARG